MISNYICTQLRVKIFISGEVLDERCMSWTVIAYIPTLPLHHHENTKNILLHFHSYIVYSVWQWIINLMRNLICCSDKVKVIVNLECVHLRWTHWKPWRWEQPWKECCTRGKSFTRNAPSWKPTSKGMLRKRDWLKRDQLQSRCCNI